MAFFRLEAKVISRGGMRSTIEAASYRTGKYANGGKSVVAAAGYRAGAELVDERTGKRVDYTNKRGVMGAEIMVPEGSVLWMQDRQQLWNAVERVEVRKDAQLARDFVLTLPHELTHEQRVALTRAFVKEQFCDKGYIADIAWHSPSGKGDDRNHHAHVLVPIRHVEEGDFAKRKRRPETGALHPAAAWRKDLEELREAWATTANRHLEAAGLDIRIDHRSLKEQGIDRVPEPKIGSLATQIERSGRESMAGNDNRDVKALNEERARLKAEHAAALIAEAEIVDLVARRLRSGEMKPSEPTEEELRLLREREIEAYRVLQQQDERIQAFKRQFELQAEEAKKQQGRSQAGPSGDQRAPGHKHDRDLSSGDIMNAGTRYSIALAENYDIRDPYGSLARSAGSEYATFLRQQAALKEQVAKEQDPELRKITELRRSIEAHEYCGLVQGRLGNITAEIAGREDHPQAVLDRARAQAYAERGQELRQARSDLIEARELQRQQEADLPRRNDADPVGKKSRSQVEEAGRADDGSDSASRATAGEKSGERRDGDAEVTDARQAKIARYKAFRAQAAEGRAQDKERGRDGDDGSR